jgi:hypothetical protein
MLIESKNNPPLVALPSKQLKTKESQEIADLTAKFLEKGGVIKNEKGFKTEGIIGISINDQNVTTWPDRLEVVKMMSEKQMTCKKLAEIIKKPYSKISAWINGKKLPDKQEREKLKEAVLNY